MSKKNGNDTFYVAGGNTKIIIDKDNLTVEYDKDKEEIIINYPCQAIARVPLNVSIEDGTTKSIKETMFNIDVCCEDQIEKVKERLAKRLPKKP